MDPYLYFLAAMVATIIIAVLVIKRRLRRRRITTQSSIRMAAITKELASKGGRTSEPGFDPDATRVFLRPPPIRKEEATYREGTTAVAGARLFGLTGAHKGRSYPIGRRHLFVGRHASCDIVLTDVRVSSQHARIGLSNDKVVLEDLGSTNGTFLNAQTNTPIERVELQSGDTIFFGGHLCDQFRFVIE
jgi:hypothetical protein